MHNCKWVEPGTSKVHVVRKNLTANKRNTPSRGKPAGKKAARKRG